MLKPLLQWRPLAAASRRVLLTGLTLLALGGTAARAQQASQYSFSQSNGTYTPITGGTVLGTATAGGSGAASLDDVIYTLPAGTIPFTFTFDGVGYTSLNVSTNGFITFGATAPTGGNYTAISNAATYNGAVAAVSRDIQGIVTAGNLGEVRYETVGTAPNRTFVVQYSNFRIFGNAGDDLNFQIRLNETSNTIQIVYGAFTVTSTGTVQVGLRGATNADFNNRSSTMSWAATTAGATNTASVSLNSMVFPASGLTFTFSPPGPTDAGIAGLVSPAVPFAPGAQPVTLVLRNYGSAPLTNVVINYSINGVAQAPFTFMGSIPAYGSQNVTVGNFTFPAGTSTIVASTSLAGDGNPANDSFTATVTTALSGTYTINNTQPTGGTNFISFTDAINALNPAGASSPVAFLVSNGQVFNENVPAITMSGSATAPIVFREATLSGSNANPKITPTGGTGSADAGIILSGADYITFDGIDIDASAVSAVEFGYVVRSTGGTNGATNNTIRNASITLNRTNTASIGLVQSANTSAGGVATTATAAGGANQNNTYTNLTISNSFHGVWLYGATVGFADSGTEVSDLTIGSDPAAAGATTGDIGIGSTGTSTNTVYGLRAFNQTGLSVHDNIIRNITANTTVYGLTVDSFSGSGSSAGKVYNNRISSIRNNSTTSTATAYGINLSLSGTTAITLDVYNNFVSGITSGFTGTATATRGVRGIFVSGGGSTASTITVAFNSVRIDSGSLNISSAAYEIGSVTATVINTLNNVFANFTGAQTTAKHYAYITTSTAGLLGNTGSVSNYNDLYVANTNNGFVGATGTPSLTAGTNDRATLADWRAATMQDANSISALPMFVSATDLHVLNGPLSNAGTPVAGISTDIDGDARNATTPDIGADEFAAPPTDLSVVALVSPASGTGCFSATEAVTVQIRNNGSAALNFATAPATVTVVVTPASGASQTLTTTLNTGTLAPGVTQNVTLPGTVNMTGLGTYSFAVTATVAGDQNTSNDVLSPAPTREVAAPTAGTLAAGASSFCVSGGTTLTLTGAANGSIQLQQSTDNVTFTNVAGANAPTFTTPMLTQTTYYRAVVTCNSTTVTSNAVTLTVTNPQLASVLTPVTVCQGAAATLSATTTTGNSVRFFSTATGGTALTSTTTGSTTTATTPALTASQTFYAEAYASTSEPAGRVAPVSTASSFLSIDTGLIFSATTGFTIQSAIIYPTGTGTITFALRTSAGMEIAATPAINVTGSGVSTPVTVPLNLVVPGPGTDYQLVVKAFTGITNLVRENPLPAGTNFPFTSPSGAMTITNGINISPLMAYYYFYSIAISAECTAASRTAIQVNVVPVPAAPTLSQATQPNGTVVLTSSAATGNQFLLNGQPIAGATGQTYTVTSPSLNGTYTVTTSNGTCTSAPSAPVTVAVVLGSRSALAGSSLLVYPNPTPNGQLTVELRGYPQAAVLTVLNVLGQDVQTLTVAPGAGGERTLSVDLSALPAGVYTLRVTTPGGMDTRRVVRE